MSVFGLANGLACILFGKLSDWVGRPPIIAYGVIVHTLIFLFSELKCNNKIITSASGLWKILKVKPSNLGPGG